MTTERLSSKIATLKDEMKRLKNLEARMLATPGQQISLTDPDARWEHEHVLEDVQRRLDEHPEKMRRRRETVEHPFWSDQILDGIHTLPNEDPETGWHGDGAARTGL